ncbi:MAG: LytR C-terminal domain-containing protein [Candidatus Latescibacteria bacterium]|nr:LytR C-terminal domain-containing protein [Candidatus Latescibacterota bacterium]
MLNRIIGITLIVLLWAGCKQPAPKSQKEVMPIRVEVLNGCEEKGLARKVTSLLRRSGFDVVNFGNAENFDFLETIVVDRSGQIEKAQQVAQTLGVENCVQQIKQDPYRIEDVLVIIGRDFHKLAFGKNLGR